MNKKFVKVMALAMAVMTSAAVFASCGKTDGSDAETTVAPSGEGSGSTATIKIGSIGPTTGENANYGSAVFNGIKIAVEEINALGGDIQFEFKGEDDVADSETAVNAYNNLLDWGMQILVGPVTTGSAIAVSAKTAEDGVFMLTPSASSTDVINGKDNAFQVCFTDPNQGTGSADYIAENMTGKKVAVIYRNDDAYSQGIRDTFIAEAKTKNIDVVYEGSFTKDTATDFSVQLTAAQSANAEVVFLPIYYQPASVILSQADAMGYKPTFFGVDGMDGILGLEGFNAKLAEGVMLLTPFSADASDERTQSFVKKYQELYNEVPNQFAADGYDGVYVVYEALKQAGCTADMSAQDLCEKLTAAITQIKVDGLTGEGMTWAASGEVSKAPRAVVIKNGAYVGA